MNEPSEKALATRASQLFDEVDTDDNGTIERTVRTATRATTQEASRALASGTSRAR